MGLDWVPVGKPKPGNESEHRQIFEYLCNNPARQPSSKPALAAVTEWVKGIFGNKKPPHPLAAMSDRALWSRLEEISLSPHVTLGSPRIGIDASANEWLARAYEDSSAKREGRPLEELEQALRHAYVAEMAPPSAGLTRFSAGSTGGHVEPYSFRAQMLNGSAMAAIIGEDLSARAWHSFWPEDLVEYGAQIEKAAEQFAKRLEIARDVTALDDDELSGDEYTLAILTAAARWCRYWGENGHPVWAYF